MCYSACISSDEGKLRLLVAEPTDDFWEEAGPASIMPWGCVGPGVQLDHHPRESTGLRQIISIFKAHACISDQGCSAMLQFALRVEQHVECLMCLQLLFSGSSWQEPHRHVALSVP